MRAPRATLAGTALPRRGGPDESSRPSGTEWLFAQQVLGLRDFSISRSRKRAGGWGLGVPGDESQVIYVWFDALCNYVSGLGERGIDAWNRALAIEHVIGKGILRFHAVYWPAILLSAGLRLPTHVRVHGYLTVEGQKIGKSLGNAIDPKSIVNQYGVDAVRYYLLGHLKSTRDGDFSRERLVEAHDSDLADQLGNLLQRTAALIARYRGGVVPAPGAPLDRTLATLVERSVEEIEDAVDRFAIDEALRSIWRLIGAANRYVDASRPWALGKGERPGTRDPALDTVLYNLADAVYAVSLLLLPFLPKAAGEILARFGRKAPAIVKVEAGSLSPGSVLQSGPPLFPKGF